MNSLEGIPLHEKVEMNLNQSILKRKMGDRIREMNERIKSGEGELGDEIVKALEDCFAYQNEELKAFEEIQNQRLEEIKKEFGSLTGQQ